MLSRFSLLAAALWCFGVAFVVAAAAFGPSTGLALLALGLLFGALVAWALAAIETKKGGL